MSNEKWRCPVCGRSFEKQNQQHYCKVRPSTIADYIAMVDDGMKRQRLEAVASAIREAIPAAIECISWSMPTWKRKHNVIHMAAGKHHIGIYPGPEAIIHFATELSSYKTSKGAIQLPDDSPLPLGLISRMASWCYEQDA